MSAKLARVKRTLIAAALLALTVAGAAGCSEAQAPTSAPTTRAASPAPAWPLPADPSAAAAKAGLQVLDREMLQVHYHAHLDIIVRGTPTKVAANIGIDPKKGITALHTHDYSGIVHIESAADVPFTLGQLFTEWGQPLSPTELGPEKAAAGEQVRLYRNGTLVPGDPAAYRLQAHDELVLWLGPATEQPVVPSTYNFPPGV
jgi:hypothetical protein